jgi:hypothetical protein
VAAALLVAGCGSNSGPKRLSHDDYVAAIDEIETSAPARDAERRFFTLAAGAETSECVAGSKAFARDIHQIIGAVAALVPPADVADLQARFLVAARQSSAKIDLLAKDVAAYRVDCGSDWNHRAYALPSTIRAQKAMTELARRYELAGGD